MTLTEMRGADTFMPDVLDTPSSTVILRVDNRKKETLLRNRALRDEFGEGISIRVVEHHIGSFTGIGVEELLNSYSPFVLDAKFSSHAVYGWLKDKIAELAEERGIVLVNSLFKDGSFTRYARWPFGKGG